MMKPSPGWSPAAASPTGRCPRRATASSSSTGDTPACSWPISPPAWPGATSACARGGKLRHFLWPPSNPAWLVRRLRRGGLYAASRDAVWDFVAALRLPSSFRLGLLGFVGTMAWLVVPVSLLALGRKAPLLGILGAVL